MFPLYKNDQFPLIPLTELQKEKTHELIREIYNGSFKLVKNNCLCGNIDEKSDMLLSQKDMFGIPCDSILCNECGLIRSAEIFDFESNINFYINYYRAIYSNNNFANEEKAFKTPNNHFIDIISKEYLVKKRKIVEIGCASGAHLYPFFLAGHECIGYDYDENYLNIGRKYGLNLLYGSHDKIEDKSIDIILLSHVMEHFTDVITELNSIIIKLKDEGILLIEVPGVFHMDNARIHPLRSTQNAHVIQYYYKDFLIEFFKKLGLEILFANERCTFLLRKPTSWEETNTINISTKKLKKYPKLIEEFIVSIHSKYLFSTDSIILKRKIILLLEKLGLRRLLSKLGLLSS